MKDHIYKVLIFDTKEGTDINEVKDELKKAKIKGKFVTKTIKGYKECSVEKLIEILLEINKADICVMCYGFGFEMMPDFSFISGSVYTLKKHWIQTSNGKFCIKSDI